MVAGYVRLFYLRLRIFCDRRSNVCGALGMTDTPNIKSHTLAELRAIRDAKQIEKPKQQFSDENLPDEFWDNARIVYPKNTTDGESK